MRDDILSDTGFATVGRNVLTSPVAQTASPASASGSSARARLAAVASFVAAVGFGPLAAVPHSGPRNSPLTAAAGVGEDSPAGGIAAVVEDIAVVGTAPGKGTEVDIVLADCLVGNLLLAAFAGSGDRLRCLVLARSGRLLLGEGRGHLLARWWCWFGRRGGSGRSRGWC